VILLKNHPIFMYLCLSDLFFYLFFSFYLSILAFILEDIELNFASSSARFMAYFSSRSSASSSSFCLAILASILLLFYSEMRRSFWGILKFANRSTI